MGSDLSAWVNDRTAGVRKRRAKAAGSRAGKEIDCREERLLETMCGQEQVHSYRRRRIRQREAAKKDKFESSKIVIPP